MSVFGVLGEVINPSQPQSHLATTINVNSNTTAAGESESLRAELERLNKYVIRNLGMLRREFADQLKHVDERWETSIGATLQRKLDDLTSQLNYISTRVKEQDQRQQQQYEYIYTKFQRFSDEINGEFNNTVQNVSKLLDEVRNNKKINP